MYEIDSHGGYLLDPSGEKLYFRAYLDRFPELVGVQNGTIHAVFGIVKITESGQVHTSKIPEDHPVAIDRSQPRGANW